MNLLVLYAIVCAALWYLGAAATITYPIRVFFPRWLREALECAACAGTWYGLACGLYGYARGWHFLDLGSIESILAVGAYGLVVTPLLSALHLHCLNVVHGVIHAELQGSELAVPDSDARSGTSDHR